MLCFPFIFRGALDVRRDRDQRGDEDRRRRGHRASWRASRRARWWPRPMAATAPVFGPDYIIPKPFDPRLILRDRAGRRPGRDGERRRPPADRGFRRLPRASWSASSSAPASSCARCSRRRRKAPKRIVYAEGEDERVLRAVQTLLDEDIAEPILIGRRDGDRAAGPRDGPAHGSRRDGPRSSTPTRDRDVFDPLLARLPAAGRPPRRRRPTPPRGASTRADRSPRRCCCNPARSMPRSAAAPAIGGGTCHYVLPIIPKRRRGLADLRAVLPDPAGRRAVRLRHAHDASTRPPSRSPR